ncbi:MAG: sugar phosphate isomerase/epimerase family protein [Bryobacterales bacterium]|nr:sugar phosphate isomerase/epimerase [Bryobacteraceae bacterium]MDW8354600.1 sugar phosphate isomerase/epimerase family protein [Bryobacterales bacterium]
MLVSRRSFLWASAAAGLAPASLLEAKRLSGLKIGVTDWNLNQTGRIEAVALAARLGFDGVEVSLGRKPVNDKLPLADPAIQEQYLAETRKHGIAVAGTCLDILHVNYLKNDPLGQKWVADGIPITQKLNARVMLLPFFGKGALTTRQEMDYVGDVLRELAPEAEKAGVILGLENTLSAEDNVRIMERARSKAVLVYYDVGNSTNGGFDIFKEIRWLGKERICQMHLKDNPHYLGEGKIDFPAVIAAMADIDFAGFANLETVSPSKSVEADMRRNLTYVRDLVAKVRKGS